MIKFRSVLLALFLVVGGLVSVPAVATADPVQPAASYQCSYSAVSPSKIIVDCTVYSGSVRVVVRCSDGRIIYWPWWGVGRWRYVFDCYPATIVSMWVQTVG